MDSRLPEERIVAFLRAELPQLLGVWLFGSHATGHAGPQSDVDLAVLVPGKLDPVRAWTLGQDLAVQLDRDVDLIDLRGASTVMQYQVVMHGRRLWQRGAQAELYECAILSDKTALDEARGPLLDEVRQDGRVYGAR